MHYATHPVPADLSPWVRMCWTLRSDNGSEQPHRLMADPCANIVFVRSGSFIEHGCTTLPGSHLAGPLGRHTDMLASAAFSLFGVYLWPWTAHLLFGIPPADQLHAMIDLAAYWTPADIPHVDALRATDDPDTVIACLRPLLLSRLVDAEVDTEMSVIVRELLEGTELPTAERLVEGAPLARRQFERRFKQLTGLPPGLFLRILRFQRCFRMLEDGRADSLTGVALAAGYFDQSHFIRDFKRFSGMNPRRYFMSTEQKADSFLRLE